MEKIFMMPDGSIRYSMSRRDEVAISRMREPVRCGHCSRIYDLGKVTVVSRYTDCSVWRCPGCNLLVDDRCEYFPMGSGRRDYIRLNKPAMTLDQEDEEDWVWQ